MVFSSIPAYLDPANWQQQPNNQIGGSGGTSAQLLRPPPPPPPPPPPSQPHVGSIRPGSMADRARMANIPLPEAALKCPRCESTNTKFCYFNNYSLSQPRHFCKTCRRYWTRGGALRSVPVGGGCRRKKRSNKAGSSSKSPVSSDRGQTISSGSTSMIPSNSDGITGDIMGGGSGPHIPPLRFMQAPNLLHHFTDHYGGAGEIGLNFSGISPPLTATGDINFLLGNSSGGGGGGSGGVDGGSFLSAGGIDHQQWRLPPQTHQFPFFAAAGFDQSPTGLFPVDQGQSGVNHEPSISYVGGGAGPVRPKTSASGIISQMASVKMEDNNNQEMNLSRQFLGIQGNDHQYWANTGTTAWTDLSGFSSSSTSQPL